MSEQLEAALSSAQIKILRYDPSKLRPVTLAMGGTMALDKFSKKLMTDMGAKAVSYPDVYAACHDLQIMAEMLEEYCGKNGTYIKPKPKIVASIPPAYKNLLLNMDYTARSRDLKFFLTTEDEYVSEFDGNAYITLLGLSEQDAANIARKVSPRYNPRIGPGVVKIKNEIDEDIDTFNTYVPPKWMLFKGEVPDKLPALFVKLVNHVFPVPLEREYFYSWLHHSLFKRAFVYLILCGVPGSGKNRLKLVLRALHGKQNSIDGKKSTLSERFNGQLDAATLAWFDELSYTMEEENFMKEIQNDSISIERKGIDATRSTTIYASSVISNNKPRDNHIAFDARKFVPLQINPARLETSMTMDEIDQLTNKVENPLHPDYDIRFQAQIGRWIKKHGKSKKWPMLEYKGPMFYMLAHTSMSRWQKKAAQLILEGTLRTSSRVTIDPQKGYLWSTLAEQSQKKNGDRSMQFPDFSTVKHLFDIFVDANGNKAFKTEIIPTSIMGDFWVKLINNSASILTEAQVIEQNTKLAGRKRSAKDYIEDEDDEDYDL